MSTSLEVRVQERLCTLGYGSVSVDTVMSALQTYNATELWQTEVKEKPYEEWVLDKLKQLVENLQYAGLTLEKFVENRGNLEWLRNMARKCGRRTWEQQEDLVMEVLVKFLKTGHIGKYNPLKATFAHHLYHAVRTTLCSGVERDKRNVIAKGISLEVPCRGHSDTGEGGSWDVSEEEGSITTSGAYDGDRVIAPLIYDEAISRFKDVLDTEMEPIKVMVTGTGGKEPFLTFMSEIWEWYWDERKTLEEMCVLAKVQQSTLRRYFDKIRMHFMAHFAIDLPLRLWSKRKDADKYGVRTYSDASRNAFLQKAMRPPSKAEPVERQQKDLQLSTKLRERWAGTTRLWALRRQREEARQKEEAEAEKKRQEAEAARGREVGKNVEGKPLGTQRQAPEGVEQGAGAVPAYPER